MHAAPRSAERRLVAWCGWAALACGMGFMLAHLAAQRPAATLKIVSPGEDTYISGPVLLRAQIEPGTVVVLGVTFFADGKMVCQVRRPPFQCEWDAGPGVEKHQIRVVAALEGNERLVESVSTKSVAYVETVDVSVVQLSVIVHDGHRFVRNLKADDFTVFEDDVKQKINYFGTENTPLELIAAVDISTSMTAAIPQVKESVKNFLSALRPTDQVTLVGFNQDVYTLARPSADLEARLKAVDRLAAWGNTALYDVVVQSLDLLGKQRGRRALVVFTDGEDQGSVLPLEVAERRAQASDATLYLIAQGRGTQLSNLKKIIERLAKMSGGLAFITDSADKLTRAFRDIVDELANQYLLSYVPQHKIRDGKYHKLRVHVGKGEYNVRARDGYLYDEKSR